MPPKGIQDHLFYYSPSGRMGGGKTKVHQHVYKRADINSPYKSNSS
ncbi:MAG: hypothetical protein H6R35_305 [Bacteroidetes bacterium]|nr:hypothetical protein [Bacteroidota bacterium]